MDSKDKKRPGSVKAGKTASDTRRSGTATKSRPAAKRRIPVPRKKQRPRPEARPQNRPTPDVVYTQPDPFNRNRFLLRLATVVAVVLALFFGMSIFFKVETVVVSGAEKYTAWDIRQASGIEEGENLLALNEAMIGGRIETALPYVLQVRVGIKLPDTVNIEIVEIDVPYAIEAEGGGWWLMSVGGKLLESINAADAEDYTRVLGVQLEAPVAGEQAVAAEPEEATTATDASGETVETVPVTVRASEQLATALDILQYLENNGILGLAKSVNVADMGKLEIWYGQQYQITLGDASRLSYKIEMIKNAIDQLGEHYSGMLDVSFTLRPEEVVYTPFS